jgi:hypothetical protein
VQPKVKKKEGNKDTNKTGMKKKGSPVQEAPTLHGVRGRVGPTLGSLYAAFPCNLQEAVSREGSDPPWGLHTQPGVRSSRFARGTGKQRHKRNKDKNKTGMKH